MRQKCSFAFFAQEKKKCFYTSGLRYESFLITNLLQLLCRCAAFLLCKCVKLFKNLVVIIMPIIILLTLLNYLSQIFTYNEIHQNFNHRQISSHVQQNNNKDKMTFYEFQQKYNKKYSTLDEELFRSIVFNKNLDKINQHNTYLNKTFTMGVNQFADLTAKQFASIYTTLYRSDETIKNMAQQIILKSNQSQYHNHNNSMIFEDINQYNPIVKAEKQAVGRHQQLSIDNPQFAILDDILSGSRKQSQIERYLKHQPLQQSLTVASSSNATQVITSANQTDGNFSTDVIDWTVYSGQIRYQGVCGACYTFATSDTVAALYSIYKFGFFIPLSTQQVVDCSTNGLTYGCSGGFLQGSYAYMQTNGLQSDYIYPYMSSVDGIEKACSVTEGPFKVASFKNIDQGDCKSLVGELQYGPVSIGIAGYRLQFYQNGIFNDCNDYIDHAVVLIAYQAGVGWKIKNSWGPQWGINGFAWIQDGNICGICNMAVSAKISV